jgi:hypothetical protein
LVGKPFGVRKLACAFAANYPRCMNFSPRSKAAASCRTPRTSSRFEIKADTFLPTMSD